MLLEMPLGNLIDEQRLINVKQVELQIKLVARQDVGIEAIGLGRGLEPVVLLLPQRATERRCGATFGHVERLELNPSHAADAPVLATAVDRNDIRPAARRAVLIAKQLAQELILLLGLGAHGVPQALLR